MDKLKNFYIKILGIKIEKNKNGSKVAAFNSPLEIKNFKALNWNLASEYAQKKAKSLKEEKGWHACDVTVIESVPQITTVYNVFLNQLKKIVVKYLEINWDDIMANPLVVRNQDKLEENDYKLIISILTSFVTGHCQEFVEYQKSVRKDEREDFDKALSDLLRDYYRAYRGGSVEVSGKDA